MPAVNEAADPRAWWAFRTVPITATPRAAPTSREAESRPLPPIEIFQAWHRRYEADAAHGWLRRCVRETVASL